MTLLEVGAVPGNHLVYFAKEFGYRVAGIDYSSEFPRIAETLTLNGVEPIELFHEDVFRFCPHRLYDVVFSGGFVEHFDPPEPVIALHAKLIAPGGWLLLAVPNTRYLHAWLMRLNCPEVLAVHNPALMSRVALDGAVRQCGFEVLFCDYLQTFRTFYPLRPAFSFACRAASKLIRLTRAHQIPNRYASPCLYLIARYDHRRISVIAGSGSTMTMSLPWLRSCATSG
jgi:SAM-dependent methyltransferase